MIINILLFIAGLVLLCYGADWLVKGSSSLARHYGIKPIIVGLTIVAIGTSAPELVVSVISVIENSKDIALGNILGSNICNIGLILGFSAIIYPLKTDTHLVKRELPIMLGASGLLYFMGRNQIISRIEGSILFAGMVSFLLFLIWSSIKGNKGNKQAQDEINEYRKNNVTSNTKNLLLIAIGMAGLVGGSYMMVKSAVVIARVMGISEFTIGLALVAIGTSLPELATSVAAALRKETEILVGNVIGSNISNILLVTGVIGILRPLNIDGGVLRCEFPIMMIFSFIIFPFLLPKFEINKIKGGILLIGYIVFITYTFYY